MKRISKTSLAAIIILVVLAAAFGVGLWLILKDNKQYRVLYEDSRVKININSAELGAYTAAELTKMAGMKEFNAKYKPSGKSPIARTYHGFELKAVFQAAGIDIAEIKSVSFRAFDGYAKGLFPSDLYKDNEIFIAIKYDGKEFIRGVNSSGAHYPEEDGGPFVIIKASSEFSYDRIRGLVEINVEV